MYISANTVEEAYEFCMAKVKDLMADHGSDESKHAFHESAHIEIKNPNSFSNSIKYNGKVFSCNGTNELYALETEYYNRFLNNKTFNQLIQVLSEDRDSKKAYLSLWDNENISGEITCLTGFHFYIKDNHLFAVIQMRSNEVYRLLPVDMAFGIAIQKYIANEMDLPMGSYVHQVASMVLYKKDVLELIL